MRAPCVIRWPGHIKPGTVLNDIFSSLDWMPTFVEIAGGPKGDELKKQIEAGKYPGIVKTTLDGVNQIDYLTGKSDKSARDTFLYKVLSFPPLRGVVPGANVLPPWNGSRTCSATRDCPLLTTHGRSTSRTRSMRQRANTSERLTYLSRCCFNAALVYAIESHSAAATSADLSGLVIDAGNGGVHRQFIGRLGRW